MDFLFLFECYILDLSLLFCFCFVNLFGEVGREDFSLFGCFDL